MSYNIDATGRVTACTVTQSSGSVALDETTCRLMKERGRFTPARDAKGKAVAAQGTRRVIWRIPEGGRTVIPVNALPLRITLTADLNEAGAATNCVARIVGPPGVPLPGNAADLTCAGTGFFDDSMHILDIQNKPAKGRIQVDVEMKLLPPTPAK
jgi:TonB family protein